MENESLKYQVGKSQGPKRQPFHFFATSVAEWKVSMNLDNLIEDMKREGLSFNVYYVPLPSDADYEINYFCPQVPGAVFLGFWSQDPPGSRTGT